MSNFYGDRTGNFKKFSQIVAKDPANIHDLFYISFLYVLLFFVILFFRSLSLLSFVYLSLIIFFFF